MAATVEPQGEDKRTSNERQKMSHREWLLVLSINTRSVTKQANYIHRGRYKTIRITSKLLDGLGGGGDAVAIFILGDGRSKQNLTNG